jgi:hypothetical protein
MRIWLAILLLALGLAAVKAMPVDQQIIIFGTQTAASNPPAPSGSALLVDGVNPALLVNGVDPACLVGGC